MGIRSLTLRQRLYVLAVLALAPAVVLLAYNEVSLRASRTAEVHRSALRLGEQASLEMQRVINGAEALLFAVGRAPALREFNAESCIAYLDDLLREMPQFTSLAVIDGQGVLRCRPDMPQAELNLAERPYFKEVMRSGSFFVGTYQVSAISGKAVLPLAMPIQDDGGSTIGMIVAGLDLEWLDKLIKARNFGPDEALTIADRHGVIIARHPFSERFVGTTIPEAYRPLVTASAPGTLEVVSQDGTARIIGYVPISAAPYGIYVSAGVAAEEAMQPVENATRRGIAIILVGALLALSFATWTGKKLIRQPLKELVTTVEQWRAGKSDARAQLAGAGEIDEVGAVLNRFMDELEAARSERRIAAQHQELLNQELEHRVKNTLAMVQAVASQTFTSPEHSAALPIFSTRLAAIGHAYSQLRRGSWISADLASLIQKTTEPYSPEQFQVRGPPVAANPRAALALSMALHELATNAAKYGALSLPDGRVHISWETDRDTFRMTWREHDGPPVVPPQKTGFGTSLIRRMLASDIGAEVAMDYTPAGLECRVEAPRHRLEAS